MPSAIDPPMATLLDTIRANYSGVPFLALGQTVFWDEPMKAVFRKLLDEHLPEARLIAGVHDTDYFAKTSAHVHSDAEYIALPHDDGRTRDLWSAAGELSSLFGSESVPTRQFFLKHAVPFDWLTTFYPEGKAGLLTDKTAAWGWTGIVHTGSKNIIAHDVPVHAIKDTLLGQLDWGFRESIGCLETPRSQDAARQLASMIRGWIEQFVSECSADAKLSDLYAALLPKFYSLLLGYYPSNFETTTSTELFRFNLETCDSPRFAVLQVFLDPASRSVACRAYNQAVAGSGIYDLDSLGEGALPFDLVIPGQGRGTLRITGNTVLIDFFQNTKRIVSTAPIRSVNDLAALLEGEYGDVAVVVGKAIILADMIAAEHLVLFHETASGYTPLTTRFNDSLRSAGITLSLYPVVRLTYSTWDSLAALPATTIFDLPPHLAEAFGEKTLPANEFGGRWRAVVGAQRRLLRELSDLRTTRNLLSFLESRDSECWCNHQMELERAYETLKSIAAKSMVLRDREEEHAEEIRVWQNEVRGLEQRKGSDWRANIQPLREQLMRGDLDESSAAELRVRIDRQLAIRATAFDDPLHECHERIRATRILLREFRSQRRALERSPIALEARRALNDVKCQAEFARLDLTRNAYLAVEGLEHTNLRPTAWWIPLVDPTGTWFSAIAASTTGRLEYLHSSE